MSNPVDEYKNIKPMLLSNTDTTHISLVSQLNNYKLYTGTHTHDATHQTIQDKFKLRVWIAPDVDASSWNTSTKLQYKFKIGLTSEEKQKGAYPEVVYRYGTNGVGIGDPLEQTTENRWLIPGLIGGSGFKTQEECEQEKPPFITDSCVEQEVQIGVGTYTEDYTTLNKSFFLKHNISSEGTVESSEVCYILNSTLYCLKGGDNGNSYESNKQILNESFGASNCNETNETGYSYYECSSGSLGAGADSFGSVRADDDDSNCDVNDNGNSNCKE